MSMSEQLILDAARRIVQEQPHPGIVPACARLRAELSLETRVSLHYVHLATRELRTYYAVCSGAPLIEGPFRGPVEAQAKASLGFDPIGIPLFVERRIIESVVADFIEQLPHERDIDLVVRLTYLYLEQCPLEILLPRQQVLRTDTQARRRLVERVRDHKLAQG